MRKLLSSMYIIMSIVFVASCSKDDADFIPSVRTDLLCAITNNDSLVTHFMLDDGTPYNVNKQKIKAHEPNAELRCISTFEINEDRSVTVYDVATIPCFIPLPTDSFKTFPKEPVNVTSVWKSGGYINLCLSPLVNGEKQFAYSFCLDSISHNSDSTSTLHSSFLFQRIKGSVEGYSTKLYHSIPLYSKDYTSSFDTIAIYINTYEGVKTYRFARK